MIQVRGAGNRQEIKHSVYGLLSVIVFISVVILILLQLQYSKNNRRDELINNYHLVISEKGQHLLSVIERVNVWFERKLAEKHYSERHTKPADLRYKLSPVNNKIELLYLDQIHILKNEMTHFTQTVNEFEDKYNAPEFVIINSLLNRVQEKLQQDIARLEDLNIQSGEDVKDVIGTVKAIITQIQRLHQYTYEELRGSVDEYKLGNQLQFLSVIIALVLVGIFSVVRILRHVRRALIELNDTRNILYESEQNYIALTQNMRGGILVIYKGKSVYANNGLANILGYENPDDLLGMAFEELIYPDDVDTVSTRCHLQMHGKKFDSQFETRMLTSTGKILFIDLNATTTLWQGESACLITIRNITEQKESQQALQKIKYTLDQTLDCVFMFDASSLLFTYVNEGALKQVGYSRDELLAMHPYDIKPDVSEEQFRLLVRSFQAGEKTSFNFETTHQHKYGSVIPVDIFLQYITTHDQAPHFIAIVRDISQRKNIEQALHESFELNDRIINESPVGMAIYDSSDQCLTANTAIAKMAGLSHEQILLQDVSALESWGTKEVLALIKVARTHNMKEQTEIGVHKASGEKVYYDFRVLPFKMKATQHVLLLVDDITERKLADFEIEKYRSHLVELVEERTADVIVARDEAQQANMAKSEFLSHMSHELRTPLNAIIGFGQLLKLDMDTLDEAQQDSVNEILVAGHHLLYLINEVLDLAKIESGHLVLTVEDVAIDTLFQQCVALVSTHAAKNNIELINRITNSGYSIQADPNRIKQVLLNLLSNAVKYNREYGRVTVNGKVVDGERFRISVTDTGTGLSQHELDQLFKSFVRLDTRKNIEGTGIGLVICKQLVECMNGTIGVHSTKGEGCTFWIELPLGAVQHITHNDEETEQQSQLKTFTNTRKKHSVLYIEDNVANLRLITKLLERRPDIQLWSATEPLLGLALAKEHKPDMILLDINLPGMNGYEVLDYLKQQQETGSTPVIAISASAMQADIERGFEAGFVDYLTKPVNVESFYAALDSVLGMARHGIDAETKKM